MGDFQSQPRSQPRFMEATISVICNKFKVLKNGESPIMVRVAKDGKRSMKSLGVSVNPIYWDFAKNCPKKNCPNRTALMQLISQTLIEYQGKVMEVKVKGENVPLSSIMEEKRNGIAPITLEDFLTSHISQLRDNGKVGNSYAYLNLRTTLHNFYGKKLNFLFNAVDVAFCNKFEAWMRKNQFEDTTMHYYFRTFRATYNKAVEAKCADREKSPFVEYKFRLNSGRAQYIRNGGKLGRKIGSVKTLEQKKEQYKDIISYLKRCYSIRTIATLTGKGISTVQRIKKDFNL